MKSWNKSLMRQMVGYFLLLSFVTVGAIGCVAYFQSRNAIKHSLFERLDLTATLKEDELNRWIEDQREEIGAIANLPGVRESAAVLLQPDASAASQEQARQYLNDMFVAIARQHSSLSEILVLTNGGRVVLSTQYGSEGTFEGLVQYSYVPLDRAESFYPNFYFSPNSTQPRMTFAIPLQTPTQESSLGLIAMHLNLERIDEIIRKRTGLGNTGETYLVGNQGSSLANYNFFLSGYHPEEAAGNLNSYAIEEAMRGRNGSGEYRNYRDIPVIGVYRWLKNRDLALIAEITAWEAFEPARELAQTIVLTGLGMAGLLAIGVYWGARRVARPILAITQAASEVAEGNLQSQAPILVDNEIGLLAKVFNQMTDQLRRLYTDLEAEVTARTAELRQANADLQQAKDTADVANQAKSQFLANISHELRTPLNAILGFSQLMIRMPSVEPTQREHLEIINRSGEHLLTLIDDVLSMSKIEAGLTILNENSFDLYGLLSSLEPMLRVKASAKNLTLHFERSPDVPQYIKTDEGKLRQVLINLLGNAIKFTEQGRVVLRVRTNDAMESDKHADDWADNRVKDRAVGKTLEGSSEHSPEHSSVNPSETSTSRLLQFEVEDTGPGIASQEIDQLFEPFVQTDVGQRSQQGTGLGLAISRQFVELMGGQIHVESVLGRGSTFTFTIRPQRAESSELEAQSPTRRVTGLAPGQPTYRILVVEDRWENRRLLVNMLTPLGFEVQEARNGQEAIAQWQSWHPHLIWMDMRMPVMDGYEATRQIKGNGPDQDTVIIALTASAFEESRSIVLDAGCDDFVRKPFRDHVIFDKMAQHLGVEYLYEDVPDSETVPLREADTSGHASAWDRRGSSPGWSEEETPQTITTADLDTLPQSWVADLRNAAIQADGDWIQRLMAQLPQHQGAIAQHLSRLVSTFSFDEILGLTETIPPAPDRSNLLNSSFPEPSSPKPSSPDPSTSEPSSSESSVTKSATPNPHPERPSTEQTPNANSVPE